MLFVVVSNKGAAQMEKLESELKALLKSQKISVQSVSIEYGLITVAVSSLRNAKKVIRDFGRAGIKNINNMLSGDGNMILLVFKPSRSAHCEVA
jgi:peptidoglycan hydrolase-like amidase